MKATPFEVINEEAFMFGEMEKYSKIQYSTVSYLFLLISDTL
jgi:hypothetical protein